ncbi:hypothetical protein MKEN_00411800 [Mycena kentingensis (nom. inval.)]|nr:hypothetical protein MKEN_00411800 [Mycena kentingensis (nom. inval.)]
MLIPTWSLLTLLFLVFAPASGTTLFPFKRSASLVARSTWKRTVIPKNIVSLEYAHVGAVSPSSSLTFSAHPNTPIMLLEDIDFLLDGVRCPSDDSAVVISFISADSYAATLAAWSSLPGFILVTAHFGCNAHDQRGAWRVVGVSGSTNGAHRINLFVQPLPLRDAGSSYTLFHTTEGAMASWGHTGAWRRDIDNVTEFDYSVNFEPRQQLIPISESAVGSATLAASMNELAPSGLEVFCTNCMSVTKFALGIEVKVDAALQIQEAHLNLTINEFKQDIDLEISFNDTTTFKKDVDVLLAPLPDLAIKLPGVANVGFFWGGAVRFELDVEKPVNFSVGASATIPKGTSATLMLSNFSQSFASGWDKATFDVHPFRLNSGPGSLTASGSMSLSPFLEATIDILDGIVAPTGRIYVNPPKIHAVANVSSNVNRQCAPKGADDYEFFDSALTFGAELDVTIDGAVTGVFGNHDQEMFNQALPFSALAPLATPSCMVIVDDQKSSDLAGEVIAPTGTLLAAASAIPSFDIAAVQAYFASHSELPSGVNYGQMLKATTVPDDIKSAVQKAGASARYQVATVMLSMTVGVLVAIF